MTCFLFQAPEKACCQSHGLSLEVLISDEVQGENIRSLVLPCSASTPFV